MKKFVSILALTAIAATVFAQKMDPFDAHVADFRLLTDKKIQADVGLTSAQVTKLNRYADANREKLLAYQSQLSRGSKGVRGLTESDPKVVQLYGELRQQVIGQLSPGQLTRLRELTLQSVGLRGMLDSVVAKKLGLTDSQLQKARTAFEKGSLADQKIEESEYAKVIEPYKSMHPKTQQEAKALNDLVRQKYKAALAKRSKEIQMLATQTRKDFEAAVGPRAVAAYRALGGRPFSPKG